MRFISAQFTPYLNENIWLENAKKSNHAAQKLYNEIKGMDGIEFTHPVESNALFLILPPGIADELRERYFFYDWDESRREIRLVCSWDTTDEDIRDFAGYLKSLLYAQK
jgi:threonine aldolase